MKFMSLSEIAEVNPGLSRDLALQDLCSFVPMEAIDETLGEIATANTVPAAEVARGYTPFQQGDVLFAKITPCMENGKCAVAQNLANGVGFGSTEFHVIRPRDAAIADWIYYFLRQQSVRDSLERRMTGSAGQRRVPSRAVEELEILLPPLAEQRRIAAILRAADDERRRRRYTQSLSDGLLREVFVRMFGDPATNPLGWEVRKLGESIDFVTSGSRGWADHYSDSGARFIRVQNLHDHTLDLEDIAFVTPPQTAETVRTRVQPNDILLAITGATIGLCALVPCDIGESYVSQHVAIIRLGTELIPVFASSFISHPRGGQLQISAINYGDTKPGLGLDQIRDLNIICPPPGLQRKFAAIVAKHEQIRRQQQESARQSDHLFETLLHRAFAGEL